MLDEGRKLVLMAYGQTGAGKTHTMFGQGKNKGLNHLMLEQLLEASPNRVSGRFL
jgi:hypothetical protein